jgi:hypothetical protein
MVSRKDLAFVTWTVRGRIVASKGESGGSLCAKYISRTSKSQYHSTVLSQYL